MQDIIGDGYFFCGVIDHQVGVAADGDGPFLGRTAKDSGRVGAAGLYNFFKRNVSFVCFTEKVGISCFHTVASVRNFCEIVESPVFFRLEERTVVCGDSVDAACLKSLPEFLPAFFAFDGWGTDIVPAVFLPVNLAVIAQVQRIGLGQNIVTLVSGCLKCLDPFFIGQMDDVKRGVRLI